MWPLERLVLWRLSTELMRFGCMKLNREDCGGRSAWTRGGYGVQTRTRTPTAGLTRIMLMHTQLMLAELAKASRISLTNQQRPPDGTGREGTRRTNDEPIPSWMQMGAASGSSTSSGWKRRPCNSRRCDEAGQMVKPPGSWIG